MLEIFSQMQSPFGQPLHRVRISLACNLSLSLPIDVKFSHDVQILVCIFFLLTRFFWGGGGGSPPRQNFSPIFVFVPIFDAVQYTSYIALNYVRVACILSKGCRLIPNLFDGGLNPTGWEKF